MKNLLIATLLVTFPMTALAETYRFFDPITVMRQDGSELILAPGYYIENQDYERLDTEVRRLQKAEVRLTAENKVLREEVSKVPWKGIFISFAVGLAAGAVAAFAVK